MQSVVRSSLIGLLAIAGLTACGDKVTENTGDNVVRGVTVTPAVVSNLAVGGSFTLAASVDAGSGVTNRTVTWSSSDAAVASVDATTAIRTIELPTHACGPSAGISRCWLGRWRPTRSG